MEGKIMIDKNLLSDRIDWKMLNSSLEAIVRDPEYGRKGGTLDDLRVVIMRGTNEARVLCRWRSGRENWVVLTEKELDKRGMLL